MGDALMLPAPLEAAAPVFERFVGVLPVLLGGVGVAVSIALGAFVLAALLGTALAVLRTFAQTAVVGALIGAYTEWQRNVPGIAHLFILYFGLPALGLRLPPVAAAIIGLGLVSAAAVCDILTAALRSLHAGQREAALAAGLTPWQTLRLVLLPQAMRISAPAFGNCTCQLLKDTSIASAIAAPEIMFFARNLVTATFDTTLIYLAVIGLYALLLAPVGLLFAWWNRHEGARS